MTPIKSIGTVFGLRPERGQNDDILPNTVTTVCDVEGRDIARRSAAYQVGYAYAESGGGNAVHTYSICGRVSFVQLETCGDTPRKVEIPGSYPSPSGVWSDGVFQFIREADGTINHRYFLVK